MYYNEMAEVIGKLEKVCVTNCGIVVVKETMTHEL